jgi:hypothetical protein
MNGNGDNYIYMAFADKREYAYWLDQSGNNNDWTSNNLTESDISVDSPTNNFCTINPLSGNGTFSEGNLKVVTTVAGSAPYKQMHYGTISASSGKYYWEVVPTDVSGVLLLGSSSSQPSNNNQHNQYGSAGTNVYNENGDVYTGSTARTDGASYGVGDIIGVALDMDNDRIYFAKNNTWANSGNPSTGSNSYALSNSNDNEQAPIISNDSTGSNVGAIFNFGQDSSFAGTKTAQGNQDSNGIGDFYYEPPNGFLALCTKNLPNVAVVPSKHFNTVLWSGSGSSQSITGVGFQPDWLWIKMRSSAYNHRFFDAIRGSANGLYSPNTNVEGDYSAYDGVTSFDTDGFSLSGKDGTDKSGETYVAWNWKANGSGSSNTNGSITSTVSANVDAGFSIVSYTGNSTNGATVGHGLSKVPELFIVKNRDDGSKNWAVYYGEATRWLKLNNTAASAPDAIWANTAPTSSVFSLNSTLTANDNGDNFIAYCFHSVDGYSKVGSYVGNGSTDGTFIYTGFRPAWVMVKRTDTVGHWQIKDTTRDTDNPLSIQFQANESDGEASSSVYELDGLSNGFKLRMTHGGHNAAGGTYIYVAFAETPFKYSNAR